MRRSSTIVRLSLARLLASAAVTALLAAGLGGCQTMSDVTGVADLEVRRRGRIPTDPRRAVEVYGERYRANPKDADAALAYGQALRATGQRAQAAAVLEQATIANPGNKALLGGLRPRARRQRQFQQAFDVLSRAHTPDNPDWRILSVQGTALDQMGRHDEARRYYASALKIVPDEPSVLSNLGLSYVLTRELPQGRGDAAARLWQHAGRRAGAAEPRAGGRPAGPLRRGRDHRARPTCRPTRRRPTSPICKEMLSRKDDPRGGQAAVRR